MRKLWIPIAIFLSLALTQELDFGKIWKQGYKAGYCYDIEYCIEPIPPVPPVPRVQDTTYETIYNRGFTAGLKDQQHGK